MFPGGCPPTTTKEPREPAWASRYDFDRPERPSRSEAETPKPTVPSVIEPVFRYLEAMSNYTEGNVAVIKSAEGDKVLKFARRTGDNWQAYSVSTRGADGKWFTLQITTDKALGVSSNNFSLRIFGGDDNALKASAKSGLDSDSCLRITRKDKEQGEDVIIQGALLAVTKKDFSKDICVR